MRTRLQTNTLLTVVILLILVGIAQGLPDTLHALSDLAQPPFGFTGAGCWGSSATRVRREGARLPRRTPVDRSEQQPRQERAARVPGVSGVAGG